MVSAPGHPPTLEGMNPPLTSLSAMPAEPPVQATWLHSDRVIPARFVRPVLRFMHVEASGGVVLLVAAVAALLWANLPGGESYERLWETHVSIDIGSFHLDESLRDWVNDGLMTIFFLVVGMEIKRELVLGDLRDPRRAALPAIAAIGGMVVPALFYLAFAGGGEAGQGWGIPMATDIAFAVGVVALLGSRVPVGAKLFVLALAIVDDIGAILVIAIFYTDDLRMLWLAGSIIALVVIAVATRVGIRNVGFYVALGAIAWFCMLESGVHATLAGVAIGLLTPARSLYADLVYRDRARWILDRYDMEARDPRADERIDAQALELARVARESVSPLARQEAALHPWSSFLIVPLFALANAGVRLVDLDIAEEVTSGVAIGVAVGLVIGKFVGITLLAWIAVRSGLGKLPKNTTWTHVMGLAAIAGIGFTVALFIGNLAFTSAQLIDQAKLGIFMGSTAAGVLGYLILRTVPKPEPAPAPVVADVEAAGVAAQ